MHLFHVFVSEQFRSAALALKKQASVAQPVPVARFIADSNGEDLIRFHVLAHTIRRRWVHVRVLHEASLYLSIELEAQPSLWNHDLPVSPTDLFAKGASAQRNQEDRALATRVG
jgi:hypothetical protein